jgi:hypothetical protein
MVLTPNVITVEELTKTIGNHYDRVPEAFYVTRSGGLLPDTTRLLPGQDVRIVPRLLGEGGEGGRREGLVEQHD